MADKPGPGLTAAHGVELDAVLDKVEPVVRGLRIGAYTIVERIGRGGMGTVFLAERSDQRFRQRVAIKLVTGIAHGPESVARFRSERQILAKLEHPYIAHLIDGGETDNGEPYLVMEYVEGEPLMSACRKLDFDERLELFLRICEAVQFAHQNLVVHRDLKPANILVTHDGFPKLLDFGIAKILDTKDFQQTVVETQVGQRLLTPDHAAPEQVLGHAITTATDVYSLGILLYELLTARRPYTVEGKRPGELEQIICERPPLAPSAKVAGMKGDGDGKGDLPLPADRLRRRLRGDIDNIVLKALRKEPERRYASVAGLADDIRRHRRGLPVSARADTWRYRSGKFIRRNAIGVSAAALLVVLLTAFTLTTLVQSQRIQREHTTATQVSGFLVEAIRSADPNTARGEKITVEELLHTASQRIATELAGQPEVQATLMSTMGAAYNNLGDYPSALQLLRQSVALRELSGDRSAAAIDTRNTLGEVLKAQGLYEEAAEVYRAALAEGKRQLSDEHTEIARSMFGLGLSLMHLNDYAAAEPLFREALPMDRRLRSANDPLLARSLTDYATMMWRLNDMDAALASFREALQMRRDLLGNDHPDTMEAVNNLAGALVDTGEHTAAEPLFREALLMNQRLLGKEHPDIAINLNNLGYVLMSVGRLEEAEPVYRHALAMDRKLLGDGHPDLSYSLNSLGFVLTGLGRYEEAEGLFLEARDVMARQDGYEHRLTGQVLANHALLLNELGRPDQAHALAKEARDKIDAQYPADHWRRAFAASVLGETLARLGRPEEARPLLEGSIATIADNTGETSVYTRRARERLARLDAVSPAESTNPDTLRH